MSIIVAIVLGLVSPALTIFIYRAAEKNRQAERERQQDEKIDSLRLEIVERFTRIETRMELDDKESQTRRDDRRREMMAIARAVLQAEMGMQQYHEDGK